MTLALLWLAADFLEVRLTHTVSTRDARPGDPVRAVALRPASVAGEPVYGAVTDVVRLGLGFKHCAARLTIRFDRVGRRPLRDARLIEVETAREHVDPTGTIHGISPAASISSSLGSYAWRLTYIAPVTGMTVWGVKFLFARAPDPEITLPRGAELRIEADFDAADSPVPPFLGEVEDLPERVVYDGRGREADRVNLLLTGSRENVRRAFRAAGWVEAEPRTPLSCFRTFLRVMQRSTHANASMAPLTLGGRHADLNFQKSLNTFSRRHHVRLWQLSGGRWAGAATEDVRVVFSKQTMRWTHAIDPEIDRERDKIVNDLAYTGCVPMLGYYAPDSLSVTGLVTDRRIARVEIDDCAFPRAMPPLEQPAARFSLRAEIARNNPASLIVTKAHLLKRTAANALAGRRPQTTAYTSRDER